MLIYFVIHIPLLLSILFDKESVPIDHKKRVVFFWIIVFTLFKGLRWNTGTDWGQFYDAFRFSDWSNIFNYVRYGEQRLEYGYMFLNVLVKDLGGNYTTFLLLTNLLSLYSFYKFSFYVTNKIPIVIFVIILFTFPIFPVRQNIAGSILLFSYRYIVERRLLPFLLITFAAMSIHASSVVFFPFYFLLNKKLSTPIAFGLLFASMVMGTEVVQRSIIDAVLTKFTFLGDLVLLRLNTYTEYTTEGVAGRSPILSYISSFLFLGVFSYYKSRDDIKFRQDLYNLSFNVYLVYLMISEFFRNSMEEFVRLRNFFLFGYPVLFAVVLLNLKGKYKNLGYMLFGLYMLYKLYANLTTRWPELHLPYISIFDSDIIRKPIKY